MHQTQSNCGIGGSAWWLQNSCAGARTPNLILAFTLIRISLRTRTVQIKVKAKGIRSKQIPGWQWKLNQARQALDSPPNKFFVLVDLAPAQPEYYVCQLSRIARVVLQNHEAWLSRYRGIRPRTPESEHTVIPLEEVYRGKEAWEQLGVLGKD